MFLLLTISGNAAAELPVANQRLDPSQCSVPAYASPERKPVKVYSAPGKSADILGFLPVSEDEDGTRKGAYVTIVSMQRDWALVADTAAWDNSEQGPHGWVEARYLRFALQTNHGFASPNPESTIMVTTDWLMPSQIRKLEDCYRDWVLVTAKTGGKAHKAWFRGACANQETTCDGVTGDSIRVSVRPKKMRANVSASNATRLGILAKSLPRSMAAPIISE